MVLKEYKNTTVYFYIYSGIIIIDVSDVWYADWKTPEMAEEKNAAASVLQ